MSDSLKKNLLRFLLILYKGASFVSLVVLLLSLLPGRLVGAAETSKELVKWRRLQRKNLNILGLTKKKEWPQCDNKSSWLVRRSRLCQKEKEQSRLSRAPDRKMRESQSERPAPWRVRGGSEREHGKRGLYSEGKQVRRR